MIIFTDLRLVHDEDVLDKSNYPIELFNCRLKRKICYACKIYYAK